MTRKLLFYIILCLLNAGGIPQVIAQTTPESQKAKGIDLCCPEIAYVHTDRDLYVAGENMFFKLYITADETLKTGRISSVGYIVLRSEKKNILTLILKMKSGSSFGCVYLPDTLKSGMYELLAFTNYMKNYDENTFFRKQLLIVNRFDKMLDNLYLKDSASMNTKPQLNKESRTHNATSVLKLILEKDSFKTREKIRLGILWNSNTLKTGLINASVSVKAVNPFTNVSIEYIAVFNDTMKAGEEISVSRNHDFFFAEEKGIFLSGRIRSGDDKPAKDECMFISTIDTASNMQYSFSNDSGNFQFLLDNYYLGKNIVLRSWNRESENSDIKIELNDKFSLLSPFTPQMPAMTIEMKKYIFSSQDLVQINKTYNKNGSMFEEPFATNDKIISLPHLFFQPDNLIYPADYVSLDNFKEISANILPGFILRKNKGTYNAYLWDNLFKAYFTRPTLIFLNGLLIDNASKILSLNSDDIEKIELCNSLRIKGELEFPGLVSIITKKHISDYSMFAPSALFLRMDNYSHKAYYQPPVYEKGGGLSPLPDFRQLLYWNPELNLKQGETNYLEFYSSDYLSEYLVEVRGFAPDGKPVSAYVRIKVHR
jgi:hypothetical protein